MELISHENIDKTDMITVRIGEFFPKAVCIFLSVIGSHEYILDTEHGGEYEHFVHDFSGRDKHDSELGVERDFGHIGSYLSQLTFIV